MGILKKIGILLVVIICSCNSDETQELSCKLHSINFSYLDRSEFFSSLLLPSQDSFKYLEYGPYNNIIKINGGLSYLSPTTGFNFFFSSEVYDSINHTETKIKVIKKHIDPNQFFLDSIIYEVNTLKKPLKKTTQYFSGSSLIRVTEKYIYENNKLKKSTVDLTSLSGDAVKNYFYDKDDNLIRIESEIENYRGDVTERRFDYFEMYDGMPNPFKDKFYIRGVFYRSLSKNNYSKHRQITERLINNEWLQLGEFEQNFIIEYNENEFPKFGNISCN